jgi:hypothetical protein
MPGGTRLGPERSLPALTSDELKVLGPVVNVDPETLPSHESAWELGKALYNWRHNTISNDPLVRIAFDNHSADRNHVINTVMRRFQGQGQPEPDRSQRPCGHGAPHQTRPPSRYGHVARRSHPSFLFAGKAVDPVHGTASEDIAGPEELQALAILIVGTLAGTTINRLIVITPMPLTTSRPADGAHPHGAGGLVIKELGYNAIRGAVNGQAALAAGIGEPGERHDHFRKVRSLNPRQRHHDRFPVPDGP